MDANEISFFLSVGFLPHLDCAEVDKLFPHGTPNVRDHEVRDEASLIEEGVRTLRKCFGASAGSHCVVPLSGGLDSRAILAGLVDAGRGAETTAVSFGEPGSYDYEISELVTREFGIEHVRIDLGRVAVDADHLLRTARNGAAWTFLFDAYYNSLICKEFGRDATYWTGWMGDILGGSQIPPRESETWEEAVGRFIALNRSYAHPGNLGSPGFDVHRCLPSQPILQGSSMGFDEQLDVSIRQMNYTRRVVMCSGYSYEKAFLTPAWVDFMLGVPRQHRVDSSLYHKILAAAFPAWYALPAANYLGGRMGASAAELHLRDLARRVRDLTIKAPPSWIARLDPMWRAMRVFRSINYIDFADAIRNRPDYRLIVHDSVRDLARRGAADWVDGDLLLRDHLTGRHDNGVALILLTALELSLKVAD